MPRSMQAETALRTDSSSCKGTWYGVGRINYSMRDSRVTDSIMGVEYDAGCWLGRVVVERLQAGTQQSNKRILLQPMSRATPMAPQTLVLLALTMLPSP